MNSDDLIKITSKYLSLSIQDLEKRIQLYENIKDSEEKRINVCLLQFALQNRRKGATFGFHEANRSFSKRKIKKKI